MRRLKRPLIDVVVVDDVVVVRCSAIYCMVMVLVMMMRCACVHVCASVCACAGMCARKKTQRKEEQKRCKIFLQLVKANKNNKAANDERIKRKGMHNKDREKTLNY